MAVNAQQCHMAAGARPPLRMKMEFADEPGSSSCSGGETPTNNLISANVDAPLTGASEPVEQLGLSFVWLLVRKEKSK